jgi:hypothetical protein
MPAPQIVVTSGWKKSVINLGNNGPYKEIHTTPEIIQMKINFRLIFLVETN